MIKHILIVVAALAVGGAIAQMYVPTQSYQPVVRIEAPNGITYTAILDRVQKRPACGVASQRFVGPILADCPECRIVLARCQRTGQKLPGLASELGTGEQYSLVRMPGVSIAIEGSPNEAQYTCELIANSVQNLGVKSAQCVGTASGAPKT